DRHDEEQIGSLLRRLNAQRVALDTDDFGFFAIQAALGAGRSWALAEHDPRKREPPRPTSSAELAARLAQHGGAQWLVTPRARTALATPLGAVRVTTPRFSVLELASPPP
ncbi:MAG TPA: hypothetical protein VEQ59_11685, partial [Polyangiaceae bacterium]|nr:hypothetical protein [Polyangiaceae bacterium]